MRTRPCTRAAARGGDTRHLPRPDLRQVAGRDLGAPLEPAAADHAEQLLAGADHGADGGAARRDHAVVGCQHLGLRQPDLLRPGGGAQRLQPGLRRALGGEVLVDLLRTQGAGGLQFARALGVGAGIGQRRLGLGHHGAALRQVGLRQVGGEGGQHLAALHHVADVDAHLGQPPAAGLGADHRLLPGRDVAVGADRGGQRRALRLGDVDGQRGLGLVGLLLGVAGGLAVRRLAGLLGLVGGADHEHGSADSQAMAAATTAHVRRGALRKLKSRWVMMMSVRSAVDGSGGGSHRRRARRVGCPAAAQAPDRARSTPTCARAAGRSVRSAPAPRCGARSPGRAGWPARCAGVPRWRAVRPRSPAPPGRASASRSAVGLQRDEAAFDLAHRAPHLAAVDGHGLVVAGARGGGGRAAGAAHRRSAG